MNITVSQNATYCAHCGHIEPSKAEQFTNDKLIEVGALVFIHLDNCKCMDNEMAHQMFNALANTMIHMDSNECLLRRAEENIINAMMPFSEMYLNDNSFCFEWLNNDMTLKTKIN